MAPGCFAMYSPKGSVECNRKVRDELQVGAQEIFSSGDSGKSESFRLEYGKNQVHERKPTGTKNNWAEKTL